MIGQLWPIWCPPMPYTCLLDCLVLSLVACCLLYRTYTGCFPFFWSVPATTAAGPRSITRWNYRWILFFSDCFELGNWLEQFEPVQHGQWLLEWHWLVACSVGRFVITTTYLPWLMIHGRHMSHINHQISIKSPTQCAPTSYKLFNQH